MWCFRLISKKMKSELWAATVLIITEFSYVKGQGLCTDVLLFGGIEYRFHPEECSEYIQCHSNPDGTTYAVYMSCPFGQHWNQIDKRCDDISRRTCTLGSCPTSTRIKGGGCRAYSSCRGNTYSHVCCDVGRRFMNGRCIPDFTCTDPCPERCTTDKEICRSTPHWTNPSFYYRFHTEDNVMYERICPGGSHFDMVECGCVATIKEYCSTPYRLTFGAIGVFTSQEMWSTQIPMRIVDGEAAFNQSQGIIRGDINLPQPSIDNPLVIRLRYRDMGSGGPQTIVMSNDCRECHQLKIGLVRDASLGNNNFQVTLSKYNRDVAQITLSTSGFQPQVDAAVLYNGRELIAVVRSNSLHYMKRTKAPKLTVMDCGMQISSESERFNGRLESISVYSCYQGGRVQDLLNLP